MPNQIIETSSYMQYEQLKHLVENTQELSLQQYKDIIHSLAASPILETAISNYPLTNLKKLLEEAINNCPQNQQS